MTISRALAETRLRKRYKEQCDLYPEMVNDIPLQTWIAVNVRRVMEYDLLAQYDNHPNWRPSA